MQGGDEMKRLSKQEKLWFNALRTEKRNFDDVPRPDPFEDLFYPQINRRHQWIKGLVSIVSAIVLISYSFSSVWANPGEQLPPNDALIPMDEVMQGQMTIKENERPSTSESENEQKETAKEREQQVESSSEQAPKETNLSEKVTDPPVSDQEKLGSQTEKKSNDRLPNTESVHTSGKQETSKESQLSTTDGNQSHHNQEQNGSISYQTENGGKMPDTATPWGSFLLRGIGLLLLGIGLRSIHRARMI